MLVQKSRAAGSLKIEAEAEGLTPIESSMGAENGFDGQEPLMLDAARRLEVGEISDPVETEEGWFIVQHTSDYDEDGTEYWKEYLTEQAKEEECSSCLLYTSWDEKYYPSSGYSGLFENSCGCRRKAGRLGSGRICAGRLFHRG